jgi:hypothetical protein
MRLRVMTDGVGWLDRVWFRRIGLPAPAGISYSYWALPMKLARLVPYRWRRWHRWYATTRGFYWLPCQVCGWEFGGHEAGGSIHDLVGGEGWGWQICSRCTQKGHADY